MAEEFQEPQPIPQDELDDNTIPTTRMASANGVAPHDNAATATGMENSSVDVRVSEATGTAFLGIISLILLLAFMRSQAKIRKLTRELAQAEAK